MPKISRNEFLKNAKKHTATPVLPNKRLHANIASWFVRRAIKASNGPVTGRMLKAHGLFGRDK